MTVPDNYLVDHLFLLVGKNPLPVFVSAWIQAKPNGSIYLLHTTTTEEISTQIEKALTGKGGVREDLQVIHCKIDSVDLVKIANCVCSLVKEKQIPEAANIGLNYTGGTKPMAIHAMRPITDYFHEAYFYYLSHCAKVHITFGTGPAGHCERWAS
jgi:hypothetical protein